MTVNRFDCFLAPFVDPFAPSSALLPVWASPRRPWPPPCRVFKWLGPGECCSPCLPGSGRACQNESAVRDMDLGAHIQLDGGRLEIVVDCHCGWVSVGSSWIEVQSRQPQRNSHQPTKGGRWRKPVFVGSSPTARSLEAALKVLGPEEQAIRAEVSLQRAQGESKKLFVEQRSSCSPDSMEAAREKVAKFGGPRGLFRSRGRCCQERARQGTNLRLKRSLWQSSFWNVRDSLNEPRNGCSSWK